MDDRKRTRAEERRHAELMAEIDDLEKREAWWRDYQKKTRVIPGAWRHLHRTAPCAPKKARLTAAFDADMMRWYRALGRGYQARMNAVLRTYMLACLAKEIEAPTDRDSAGKPI